MSKTGHKNDMNERQRAKQGGYKTFWHLENLQAINDEISTELETLLNVRVDQAEMYRLIAKALLKLNKSNDEIASIKKIYEVKE